MSDDDWDADDFDVDAALAEKEKAKQKAMQEEDEDSTDSEEERRKAAAKAKPKPKPKAKEKVEVYVELEDKEQEKLRRQKLVEEADMRLAGDLFSGLCDDRPKAQSVAKTDEKKTEAPKVQVVYNDAFDKVELKTQADVDKLSSDCLEKINKGKAKGSSMMFVTGLLKGLEDKLTLEDLQSIEKILANLEKQKKVEKTTSAAEKRKTNEKLSKTTKFNTSDELSTVYGGGGDDWDEWDEDWDEY